MSTIQRIFGVVPSYEVPAVAPWEPRNWPCYWIQLPDQASPPFAAAYKLHFRTEEDVSFVAHVSADERYELFLDGARVGRGPERGDLNNWFYESYQFSLTKGEHVLVARVWSWGELAPEAQMSARHGFLFMPQDAKWLERLGTGIGPWEAKQLNGYTFPAALPAMCGVGARTEIDAAQFDWNFERGDGSKWKSAARSEQAGDFTSGSADKPIHLLKPATLPPMLEEPRKVGTVRYIADEAGSEVVCLENHHSEEAEQWNAFLRGASTLEIAPHTQRRVLVDLEEYYCAYPELVTNDGAGTNIHIRWAESLYETQGGGEKGNRDDINGKSFRGAGDIFRPDSGKSRLFEPLWWECGRYVQWEIETAHEPLILEHFTLRETRYPLEDESEFAASDNRLEKLKPALVRALQMNAHETYMDCPYYEQLMYVGDLALQALAAYPISPDNRLPRKAIRLINASRGVEGFTQSRYPSRSPQFISTFSAPWVSAVYQHGLWRGDREVIEESMPGVRAVVEAYASLKNEQGLLRAPKGWNFFDAVSEPHWKWGVPPDGESGVSGLLNWHAVWMLGQAAQLEEWVGEPELAARNRRFAKELAQRLLHFFWDESRQTLADDLEKRYFSQHTHALAILSGQLNDEQLQSVGASLLQGDITPAALFFQHHIFEAVRVLGKADSLIERLQLWFDAHELGVKCTLEDSNLNATRSDCHGWTAHPLFHYFATLLGVRPAGFGFESVEIVPSLGDLEWARGAMIHPKGQISVELKRDDRGLDVQVSLPENTKGVFVWQGKRTSLLAGPNSFHLTK